MIATVVLTFAVGIVWELMELCAHELGERLDVEPLLINYGRRDTVVDLVFDVVGAALVIGAGLRVFVPLSEQFRGGPGAAVVGAGWVGLGGTGFLALSVRLVWAVE